MINSQLTLIILHIYAQTLKRTPLSLTFTTVFQLFWPPDGVANGSARNCFEVPETAHPGLLDLQ